MIPDDDPFEKVKNYLAWIEHFESEKNYDKRNLFIIHAWSAAISVGLPCGLWRDPDEPDWPVVCIELPTGQVSWHIPYDENKWDGHSTEEKYRRIEKFVQREYQP